jgi:two-component system phosphate regulon sensor histidine kinase PhoR
MMLMHIKSLLHLSGKSSNEHLEHQRLTSLVNSMADAVVAVDDELKIVLYNAAALNVLDVNNIAVGMSLPELVKPIDKENQPVDLVKMIKDATVAKTSRDLRLQYKDSSFINLYLSIAPVRLGYGKEGEGGYVLLFRDITREKSLEEEREEFVSVVSHELRTPIAATEGNISNAQLIVEKAGDKEAIQAALNEAHNQILYLSDMINDLATLSRAERNQLDIEVSDIKVPDLISSVAGSYVTNAQAKGLLMQMAVDPSIPDLKSSQLYVREILQVHNRRYDHHQSRANRKRH